MKGLIAIIKSISRIDNKPIHIFSIGDRVNFIEEAKINFEDGGTTYYVISIDRGKEGLVPSEDLESYFELDRTNSCGAKAGKIAYSRFIFSNYLI